MIDEEKLIEEIEKLQQHADITHNLISFYALDNIKKYVENMPKVNEWIPVEERLPDKGKDVIVTYIGYNTGGRFSNGTAFYDFGKWWWSINNSIVKVKIIAWMPLPKEYEKE